MKHNCVFTNMMLNRVLGSCNTVTFNPHLYTEAVDAACVMVPFRSNKGSGFRNISALSSF